MNLFKRYIKSATFNNPISQKSFRTLQLTFFSLWIICIIPVLTLLIQGIISVPLYFESVNLKEKYQVELTRNRQQKEQIESNQRIIEQSKNEPEPGAFKFIDSINKTEHIKKPTISKGYQESESVPIVAQLGSFDLQPWKEVGIVNPSPYNDNMPDEAISINSYTIFWGVFSLIIYSLVFIIPWILIRCFFWIKSDSTKPVSN